MRNPRGRKNKERDVVENAARELELHPVAEINEYYIDVSNKYKVAKYAVLIFLVVFVLCMISVFRSDITLENCKYLIRSFTSGVSVYTGSHDEIYYDTAGVVDIELFNGDLVTVKNNGIDFYDLNGNNTESYNINFASPTVISKGKYMLVYDLGGNSFKLYNNFSLLYEESFDYPISCAAVSEKGMYAVVTESLDRQSVVNLYDHNFDLVSLYRLDKQFITDIKINSDASKVLFTSFSVTPTGEYHSEVVTYAPYSDKVLSNYKTESAMAMRTDFNSDGGYSVLSDKALVFFDKNNQQINEFKLGNILINKCLMLDNYVVLGYNKSVVGSQNELLIFSNKGEQLAVSSTPDKILGTAFNGEKVYFLMDSKVMRLDLKTKKTDIAQVDNGANGIYICDDEKLVLSFSNKAKIYELDKLFK